MCVNIYCQSMSFINCFCGCLRYKSSSNSSSFSPLLLSKTNNSCNSCREQLLRLFFFSKYGSLSACFILYKHRRYNGRTAALINNDYFFFYPVTDIHFFQHRECFLQRKALIQSAIKSKGRNVSFKFHFYIIPSFKLAHYIG